MVSASEHANRGVGLGEAIIVVSGLPRSGTSMTMKMLVEGGIAVLTDGIRAADESNPEGYYEFEKVKQLDKAGDLSWLNEARGKAVKIISYLLQRLPDTFDYRVIFMHRDLHEVIASQNRMLERLGEKKGDLPDDVGERVRRRTSGRTSGRTRAFLARIICDHLSCSVST